MRYFQSNLKSLTAIVVTAVVFAACNSNQSESKISDTASTPAYTSADTSTQVHDTAAAVASADTSAMKMSTPASADSSKKVASGTSKKKGVAVVKLLPPVPPKSHKIVRDKSGVYEYSEVMPSYPGGNSAIEKYITNNIEYPQIAAEDGKEGRVLVAFTVDENGKVTDAHTVTPKLGDGLDEEAVRVVSKMPGWTAGTVKGKPVKARMTLPITFQIEQ